MPCNAIEQQYFDAGKSRVILKCVKFQVLHLNKRLNNVSEMIKCKEANVTLTQFYPLIRDRVGIE